VTALPSLAPERARAVVDRMAGRRLLVLGDVMIDHFIVGRVSRISPEAPVPVVAFDRDEYRAGGAANVALNGRALGAHVDLIGLIGSDAAAERLADILKAADVSAHALITDEKRRTTAKVRVVTTRNQQVARVDYETDEAASEAVEDAVIGQVQARAARADAIIVSDYLKGIVTRRIMQSVIAIAAQHSIPVLVDPKIPHLDYYAGATLVTPNHHEAEVATHLRIRSDDDARQAATLFRERAQCAGVLITRGEHGMWLAADGVEAHHGPRAPRVISVMRRKPNDGQAVPTKRRPADIPWGKAPTHPRRAPDIGGNPEPEIAIESPAAIVVRRPRPAVASMPRPAVPRVAPRALVIGTPGNADRREPHVTVRSLVIPSSVLIEKGRIGPELVRQLRRRSRARHPVRTTARPLRKGIEAGGVEGLEDRPQTRPGEHHRLSAMHPRPL